MTDGLTLEQRLAKLEAKDEIRELVAHYGIVIDDRDLDGIEALFTRDGSFRSKDGVFNAIGRDAVMDQFRARFAVLGPTNHFAHEHIITLDTTDCASAAGLVTSHAEVWRNGVAMIAALRYEDIYRVEAGRWRFAERLLSFLYYMPITEYPTGFGDRLRQRAYGDHRPADYPEALPSWKRFHDDG